MCDRPSLLRLLAELDQQLAEAEASFAEVPLTVSGFTLWTEIVDVLRAAVADVEWQLARDCVKKIGERCLLSDRPLRLGTSGTSELSDENGVINEFIAAPDAQSTLESVLMQLQSSCPELIVDDERAQIDGSQNKC